MENDNEGARGKDTVSDEEWARVLGEAPEGIATATNGSQQGKADNLSMAKGTGGAGGTDEAEDSYKVGYGRPPKYTRFSKGRSGNAKGRPKGVRNFQTDVKETLQAPVRLTNDGKPLTVSTQQAALLRLREKALQGDARALDRLLALAQTHNGEELAETTADTLKPSDEAILENYLASLADSPAGPDGGDGTAPRGDDERGLDDE